MKQYKLIKWYPGCGDHKEGDVIIKSNSGAPIYLGRKVTSTLHDIFISKDVENNPEFWEEIVEKNPLKLEVGKTYKLQYKHCESPIRTCKITRITTDGYPWMECSDYHGIVSQECYNLIEEFVEKDYEILSYRNFITGHVNFIGKIFLSNEGYREFKQSDLLATNSPTNRKVYFIYSVKRLSDGEVFTIGDKVKISKLQHEGSFIIDRFYFDCNNDKLLCNGKCTGNGHVSITKIEKVKQPLFTTEDGVDIFEGDNVHWVCDEFTYFYTKNVDKTHCNLINSGKKGLFKIFPTKEAAEEYILMNKPCLSINEVMSVAYNPTETSTSSSNKLKELVKSKL